MQKKQHGTRVSDWSVCVCTWVGVVGEVCVGSKHDMPSCVKFTIETANNKLLIAAHD